MNSADNKFVIWSDGSFTSMGIDASTTTLYSGSDKLLIKDPVSIIFSTTEVKNEETGGIEPRLNFEMIPYLFGALLTEGENVWEIDARHVLKNHNISPVMQTVYHNTVAMTDHVKRSENGDVEIVANN
jgi:hypothetical protein